jgi:hypothetical protein
VWSKCLFANARLELQMANDVIKRLDEALDRRQLSQDKFQLRKDLKARILGLAAAEQSCYKQASQIVWLKEGNACTRFFHLKAKMEGEGKTSFPV